MALAVNRGFIGAAFDQIYGWFKGLPPELCNYSIERVQIPLEKDMQVDADLYKPLSRTPLGTVLVRSPYGITFPSSLNWARIFAARGYQVLISDCRGTFTSAREFEPAQNEAADGHATIAWMRQQDWYTGSFATLGGSYLGYNQWSILSEPPKDMKAAIITTGPHSFANFIWGSGALGSNIIAWADIQTKMGAVGGLLSVIFALRTQERRLKPIFEAAPLMDAIDEHFQGRTPTWLTRCLTESDPDQGILANMQQDAALEEANLPILLTAGWNDLILPDVMHQYRKLQSRGCEVALTVGPWTHLGLQSDSLHLKESLQWLDHHLAEQTKEIQRSPVRIHITGAGRWKEVQAWPPATQSHEMFLTLNNKLEDAKPTDQSTVAFTFDPENPTPSMAHPLLFDNGPGRNSADNPLAERSDVVAFTSDPLKSDIEVLGRPHITLQHSTDHPYADILVLLSDVDPKGKSKSITEIFLRLDSNRGQGVPLELDLTDCAHRILKGHQIRILIAGGSHPRYIRNLGTGEDVVRGTKMQSVEHTVRIGESKIVLPVLA